MILRAKNWPSYQSYKDRKPPWIRLHKSLLDDYDYQRMSDYARALLPMLWLLASEHEDPTSGLVTDSLQKITFRLRTDIEKVTKGISEIVSFGFFELIEGCIEPVTESLRDDELSVTPETETETETEKDIGKTKSVPEKVPIKKIVELYHEILPGLPKCAKLTTKREGYIRQRWREDMPDLGNWRNFFEHVNQSDFLMGRAKPLNGHNVFRADIEWLTNPSNFTKIAEGKYHVRK